MSSRVLTYTLHDKGLPYRPHFCNSYQMRETARQCPLFVDCETGTLFEDRKFIRRGFVDDFLEQASNVLVNAGMTYVYAYTGNTKMELRAMLTQYVNEGLFHDKWTYVSRDAIDFIGFVDWTDALALRICVDHEEIFTNLPS